MLTLIHVELAKLKRSLALLLCVAAPACVAALCFMMALRRDTPATWELFAVNGEVMWAYFMLPMTVTALTVLVAQMEHAPKAWNHLLALPVLRWKVFLAKALVVLGLVALMSVALYGGVFGAGLLAERLKPGVQLTGPIPLAHSARILAAMYAGALLMVVVQLWAALRFRSFVVPLILGIAGTFAAVAATAAEEGVFFPWLIPVNALAHDPERAAVALSVGFFGGLAALVAMLLHLGRHEVV
ncbi:ABC transporter permease [Caulobacter sp. 17J65-9]|uniref:ABC transporter permease n=1 Tax=Caulobacter sp. 17J65-9 TaxID=2709382 RepID=UPI0013C9CCB3|nr:ABC transporter permease [Caulobacter sp. 17J65-9]NEX92670.1 ABC transporter permease subunit [Caulobacter sp. 17J65-9]